MKQVIRLTEGDLHKIIEESVNRILNERTKSEKGLSDNEVTRKRTLNFADSVEPEYNDSIYDDEQQCHFDRMNSRRKMHHKMTQKHKNLKESFGESNYTHFAVNKKTNLIVNGWDYSDYDNSELRAFENDYFWDDMRDYEFNPKDYRILSRKGCLKLGINPDDMDNCWSNRGEIPCVQERMNK